MSLLSAFCSPNVLLKSVGVSFGHFGIGLFFAYAYIIDYTEKNLLMVPPERIRVILRLRKMQASRKAAKQGKLKQPPAVFA